jgi:hypothetical protein
MKDLNELTKDELLFIAKTDTYFYSFTNNVIKMLGLKLANELQIEVVKNLCYYNNFDDAFVNKNIKDKEIKELYYKIKKVRNIIK